MKKENKDILLKMFDIRPVNERGELDFEKVMNSVGRVIRMNEDEWQRRRKKITSFNYSLEKKDFFKDDFSSKRQALLKKTLYPTFQKKKKKNFQNSKIGQKNFIKARTIVFNRFLDDSFDQIITPLTYRKRVSFSDITPRGETPDFLSEKRFQLEKSKTSKKAFSKVSSDFINFSKKRISIACEEDCLPKSKFFRISP